MSPIWIAIDGWIWMRSAARSICLLATCGWLGVGLTPPAAAQPTNARVTMIVPASAGGSTDVIARLLGEHMARTLDRVVLIENVSGGATTLASARTATAAPDGTTVLIAQLPLLAAPFLFTGLSFDTQTAFAPVGLINTGYTILMASKRLAQTPVEAVAWLRVNGTSANIGHGGIGSSGHFCALLLARALGIRPTFVAYRGGSPAMNDLAGGTLDLVCDQSTNAVPQVQAGVVRGILVAGPARLASIPETPTSAELGLSDVSLGVWHGMYVARATPRAIVDRLNAALGAALADAATVARFDQLGTSVFPPDQRSPEAHAAMFEMERQRIGGLLSGMRITPQTVE